ncbi:AraC family transcriptional regulator [Leptospira kemamanensis]|uniref:AraC family transcriptional regulator n=1 Tax=Leptospira kemamanensis TaxID=2484942 RepID=A0A4R9JVH3_9LEPT|nr:helix-turn-helix domain-containing protein [Leptospira kemamanensis]TGL56953.1 AraC family transcriptional regulator [Leptospira kemamanensis]
MDRKKGVPTKGVLRQSKTQSFTKQNRYFPKESLKHFIEHYWSVTWDFPPNVCYTAETLPYPSVHIVFENGKDLVYGVHQKRFSVTLQGKGSVFGIKFLPGGFYPVYQKTMASLTNGIFTLESILNPSFLSQCDLNVAISKTDQDENRIQIIESWLESIQLNFDPKITLVNQIIDFIRKDITITRVEQISKFFSIKLRSLQRLFNEYVGVNPKWIIQQFRMQEIAERIEKEKLIHFADFSNEFGFFDQAHFNRMFKKMIGLSPEKYLKSLE